MYNENNEKYVNYTHFKDYKYKQYVKLLSNILCYSYNIFNSAYLFLY